MLNPNFKESLIMKENSVEKRSEILYLAQEAVTAIKNRGLEIGAGKTAKVLMLEKNNLICLKSVDKNVVRKERIQLDNHVNEEMEFLDKLSNPNFLKEIGLANKKIVPAPLLNYEDQSYGFLFMEHIDGVSLQEIIDKKNLEHSPQEINWSDFFQELENIVSKLNRANLYHRDLHAGNIMIDQEKKPIIIDFGNAYKSFLNDEDPYERHDFSGVTRWTSDEENIKRIKNQII